MGESEEERRRYNEKETFTEPIHLIIHHCAHSPSMETTRRKVSSFKKKRFSGARC